MGIDTLKIGQVITSPQQKDAVHMAIVPVVVGHYMMPGTHVGFDTNGRVTEWEAVKKIGIIDPFLTSDVDSGETVWLFLYPGSITSLRHDWDHPDFKDAVRIRGSASEEWLRAFCRNEGIIYEELIEAAGRWLQHGRYWAGGLNADGECRFSGGEYVPDDFWLHYQNVTNTVVDRDQQDNFFTCSC